MSAMMSKKVRPISVMRRRTARMARRGRTMERTRMVSMVCAGSQVEPCPSQEFSPRNQLFRLSHVTTDFLPSLETILARGAVAWVGEAGREMGQVVVRVQVQGSGLTQVDLC